MVSMLFPLPQSRNSCCGLERLLRHLYLNVAKKMWATGEGNMRKAMAENIRRGPGRSLEYVAANWYPCAHGHDRFKCKVSLDRFTDTIVYSHYERRAPLRADKAPSSGSEKIYVTVNFIQFKFTSSPQPHRANAPSLLKNKVVDDDK